jgi:perosamine synthetase
MTDLQAALALPQLRRYESVIATRRRNADLLSRRLERIAGLIPPSTMPGRTHVWHQYTVRVTPDARLDRDEFVAKLGENGIGAGIYYPKLVFDYDAFRSRPDVIVGEFPIAERVVREVVSLPVHPHLTDSELEKIADVVEMFLGKAV